MQISALNVSPNPANMAASNNVSNVPPAPYAQAAAYQHHVPYNQSSATNSAITSAAIANGSASFPAPPQLQPHQAMHSQPHLHSSYAPAPAIPSSMLPVDDAQAASAHQFAPAPQPADSLQGSYPWADSHQALAAAPQPNSSPRHQIASSQPPQRFTYMPQQLRGQQSPMLPLPMVAAPARSSVSAALTSAALPPGLNALGSSAMLSHMGGTMAGMASLPQANSSLMPIGLSQPGAYAETDGAAGGRAFAPPQLDMMGAPLRGAAKAAAVLGRSPYDTAAFGAHAMGSLPPAAAPNLADLQDPTAFGAPTAAGVGVKHEDSSGPFMRPMKQRSRMPRSRRKSQPPGTPCVPVHLRNPKKGRDRVFRKCQYCNHDNHIRRSNCDSCKQPLPAGKRRRDGTMSFSAAAKKAAQVKAATAAAALKSDALKSDNPHLQAAMPVSSAPPPPVAPIIGVPQPIGGSPPSQQLPPPATNASSPVARPMPVSDAGRPN